MNAPFKPGDTLNWPGVAGPLSGVTDFTGYTLQCQFRSKPGDVLLAQAVIDWVGPVNIPTPAFLVTVAKEVTIDWPENATVVFDIILVDPTGNITTTTTGEFTTDKRVSVLVP